MSAKERQTTRCGVVEEQPDAGGGEDERNDRRKPGIELGKFAGQESSGVAWEEAGACAENSAIVTFGRNFKEKFRRSWHD